MYCNGWVCSAMDGTAPDFCVLVSQLARLDLAFIPVRHLRMNKGRIGISSPFVHASDAFIAVALLLPQQG